MARIDPSGNDRCVLTVSARVRLSFRRGALEHLLDPGMRTHRVPLMRNREDEGGELALNPNGRLLIAQVHEPPRRFVCVVAHVRAFLAGTLASLPLVDVTPSPADERAAQPPSPEETRERLKGLAERTRQRLGGADGG